MNAAIKLFCGKVDTHREEYSLAEPQWNEIKNVDKKKIENNLEKCFKMNIKSLKKL